MCRNCQCMSIAYLMNNCCNDQVAAFSHKCRSSASCHFMCLFGIWSPDWSCPKQSKYFADAAEDYSGNYTNQWNSTAASAVPQHPGSWTQNDLAQEMPQNGQITHDSSGHPPSKHCQVEIKTLPELTPNLVHSREPRLLFVVQISS